MVTAPAMRAPPLSVCNARLRSSTAARLSRLTRQRVSDSSTAVRISTASSWNTSSRSASISSSVVSGSPATAPGVAPPPPSLASSATTPVSSGIGANSMFSMASPGAERASSVISSVGTPVVSVSTWACAARAVRLVSAKRCLSAMAELPPLLSAFTNSVTVASNRARSSMWSGCIGAGLPLSTCSNFSTSALASAIIANPSERALPASVCVARNSASDTKHTPLVRQAAISLRTVVRCPRASFEKISSRARSIFGNPPSPPDFVTGAGGISLDGTTEVSPASASASAAARSPATSTNGTGPPSSRAIISGSASCVRCKMSNTASVGLALPSRRRFRMRSTAQACSAMSAAPTMRPLPLSV